jgi:protein-L-isoaspartate(D-aspartate) O-methyltransferase
MAGCRDLRDELVEVIGPYGGERVLAAFRAVPRHRFLPDVPIVEAYRDQPVVTRRDETGLPTSSSSQPAIMALMLEQLDVREGQRVLEIGAGTGYNAALLGQLVGAAGRVTSVDIDRETVDTARKHLSGIANVTVKCGDGADGDPDGAPYDRVICTVGVWDIAPAWREQLSSDGRIVLPLDLRGVQRTVAFERDGDDWVSRSVEPCGFMRLRGRMAGPEVVRMIRPGLTLSLPDPHGLDPDQVGRLLDDPGQAHTTDLPVSPPEIFGGLSLWLAIHEPAWCVLNGQSLPDAPVQLYDTQMTAGVADPDGLALLTRTDQLGATAYGPAGDAAATRLLDHVRAWHEAGRPGTKGLHIRAIPPATPATTGEIIDKTYTRLVITQT